jgi:ATP-dependent helicase HrpA
MCRDEYLHYLRIREWQDVHTQLKQVCRSSVWRSARWARSPTPNSVARSVLAGLLSHIGLRNPDTRGYDGARGATFAIFPGSGLFKKPPQWVMAAELVETTRLWARECSRFEPEWAEKLGAHLVKRSYSEPHWERKRAAVVALEKVTLYGLPLIADRKVTYGRIDPVVSRELFIRHALVEGDWDTRHPFFAANRSMLEDVEELEERVRRRDIRVDDETLFEFYDERVGADVVSGRHFDTWWKQARREQPDLLDFEQSLLVRDESLTVAEEDFPDEWRSGDGGAALVVRFRAGHPVGRCHRRRASCAAQPGDAADFWWHVPGRREELVTALIKTLPKQWRRQFVPAPDHARAVAGDLVAAGSIVGSRGRCPAPTYRRGRARRRLRPVGGPRPPPDALSRDRRRARDRHRQGPRRPARATAARSSASALARVAVDIEEHGLTGWTLGDLPRHVEHRRGSATVPGYPALVDEGATVGVRVFEDEAEQAHAMRFGTRRMLLLTLPRQCVDRQASRQPDQADPGHLAVPGTCCRCWRHCTASAVRLPAGAQRRAGVARARLRAAGRGRYARTCTRSRTRT